MVFNHVKGGKRTAEDRYRKTVCSISEEREHADFATVHRSMENLSISKNCSSKSSAEYSRKWRERKKQEPEFLENERSRKKKERQNMTPEMKATVKEKARLRQKIYRQRQKLFGFLLDFIENEDVNPEENVPEKRRKTGEEEDENGDPLRKPQMESRECSSDAWCEVQDPPPYGHFGKESWLHPHSAKHSSKKLLGISTDYNDRCLSTETSGGNTPTIVPMLHQNKLPEINIFNVENELSCIGESNRTHTGKVQKVQSPSITSTGQEARTDYIADEFGRGLTGERSAMLLHNSDICVDIDISNRFLESDHWGLSIERTLLDPSQEQTAQSQFDLSNSEASSSHITENITAEGSDDVNVDDTSTNVNRLPTFLNEFDDPDTGLLPIFDSSEIRFEQEEGEVINKKTDELVDDIQTTGNNSRHGFRPYKKNACDICCSLSRSRIRQQYGIYDFFAQPREVTIDIARQPTNNTSIQVKSCEEHAEKELANAGTEAENVRQAIKQRTARVKLIIDNISKRCLTVCDEIEKENCSKFENYRSYFHDSVSSSDGIFSNTNVVVPGRKKLRFSPDDNISVNKLNNIFGMVEVVPTEAPNDYFFGGFLETLPCL